MVTFTLLPMSDVARLVAPAHHAQFLRIGQLFRWVLTETGGTYSGLMIVGEQGTPSGFQTMASMTIDGVALPPAKVQQLASIVNGEFIGRGIVSLNAASKTT